MDQDEWDVLQARAREVLTVEDAWNVWWLAAAPHIEQWASSPSFLGRIALDEDHRREVVVLSWERLQDREFAKLRAFFEGPTDDSAGGGRRFKAWLRRVVKNIGIDYMRSLPEYVRKRPEAVRAAAASPAVSGARPSHDYWQSIVSITSSVAAFASPAEGRAEAQRMLEFLDEEISPRRRRAALLRAEGRPVAELARELGLSDVREAERVVARAHERLKFRKALELWSQGYGDDEIARLLELADAAAAERMIKAAKELLRRNFRP